MSHCLLKLQIGPVQDFIAQARSTRDLWSGSYLLSWLVASGLSSLMEKGKEAGLTEPDQKDCVVFPQLKSQPLMQKFQPGLFPQPPETADRNDEMLTPNLTNLFLAQLPLDAGKTVELAQEVEKAIRNQWKAIANKCWQFGGSLLKDADKDRLDRQVAGLLHIAWQVTPMVRESEGGQVLKRLPMSKEARTKLAAATGIALYFPLTLALNSWQLDAVRQVRDFPGACDANLEPGKRNEKDSLTGREEQIVGGRDWWNDKVNGKEVTVTSTDGKHREVPWEILFRERQASEYFGTITFIKRVWHLAVLEQEHGLEAGHRAEPHGKQFPFPSTLHVASHDPAKNEDDPREPQPDEAPDDLKYFAVLTMDGDEMGKWMSGEKFDGLADEPKLQGFSHGLSTFGLNCARPIVEACDGRLIYSGGDDVVALLPADTALQCAQFLRMAFKGRPAFIGPLKALAGRLLKTHQNKAQRQGKVIGDESDDYALSRHMQNAAAGTLFAQGAQTGELILHPKAEAETLQLPADADVSAGIAVAHFKSPLQDVVREAQTAERRAKKQLGRSAVAITLMKRSGEITEWGCKWEQHGLAACFAMLDALSGGVVSGKFPHRIIELVERYQTDAPDKLGGTKPADGFDQIVTEVLKSEIGTAAERQKGPNYSLAKVGVIQQALMAYLDSIPEADRQVRELIGLCQTVAFAHRTASESDDSLPPASPIPPTPVAERQPA